MLYLLLGYLAFSFTLMYSVLQKNGLFEWWGMKMGIVFTAVFILMSLVFLAGRMIRRIDLVDAAWGWAAIVAVVTAYMLQRGSLLEFDTQMLVVLLVTVWGVRLSSHIIRRIRHTTKEDPRYVELRDKWRGNKTWNSFVRIYLLQAVLVTLVAMPAIHTILFSDFQRQEMGVYVMSGLGMWLIGFVIESIADRQLRKFTRQPENKGKIMNRGLWRYSRHPNYFGELLQWWGMYVICLSVPVGWLFGLVGPMLLTYLILFVSGIPLMEKRFEGRKGWAEYKATTSAIIPLPHRQ